MKKSLVLFAILVSLVNTASLYAQNSPSPVKKVYLGLGAGGGSHQGAGVDISLHFVVTNNWVATL
jgi:hypothetical protein